MYNHGKITGILMLIIGVILLIWPGTTLIAFCQLLGWCLVIGGAVEIVMGIAGTKAIVDTAGGAVAAIIGVVCIARPGLIISFLPFVVGLATALGGAAYLARTLLRKEQGPTAVLTIGGSIIAIIVGIVLMVNAYTAVKLLMIVLGIFLIYFGILRIGRS